jgi:hypothetical protein
MESLAPTSTGWSRRDTRIAIGVFLAAFVFHVWGATLGWNRQKLLGNLQADEFRQTQTAISALFIQRDHNYSLAYPTPLFGRPWSAPLEFPLYQWLVVGLSNATHLPLAQSGRAISLVSFYLALPALFLLLGLVGLSPPRRLVMLAFVLSCPIYIFYSQTFLIETLAWAFGVWFLLGFANAALRQRGFWWLLAAAAGIGVALVKVTTFLFFLLPAGAILAFVFWRDRPDPAGTGSRSWRRIALQSLASVLPACLATLWWTRYTDAIKAQSVAGNFLNSWHQHRYIFGIGVRFSREFWSQHLSILFRDVASPVVLAIASAAMLFTRRRWLLAATLVACFFVVQEIFPILYAWHEYYYVANAAALMIAIGLAADGLFDSRLSSFSVWAVVVGLLALQTLAFGRVQFPILTQPPKQEVDLVGIIDKITEPDDLLVIAGADWASLIPYYSQRRALMIRYEDQADMGFVRRAFASQAGGTPVMLMLQGNQCSNRELIELAMSDFHLDPRPVFKGWDRAIYLTPERRKYVIDNFDSLFPASWIELAPESQPDPARFNDREITWEKLPARQREAFNVVLPRPWKIYARFGTAPLLYGGRTTLGASASTKLWFKVPPGPHTFSAECAILPEAYSDKIPPGDRTDGVEFAFTEIRSDGTVRELAKLYLNPAQVTGDRNLHRLEFSGEISRGSDVVLETRPGPYGNYSRDWAVLARVTLN